ncbi:SNF2 family N-terminal domain-containing protein [Dipodascopsis uninucleata]
MGDGGNSNSVTSLVDGLPTPRELSSSSSEVISSEQQEFNDLDNEKKLTRLRFLIERSKVYASILTERLTQQQQEKAKLREQDQVKQEAACIEHKDNTEVASKNTEASEDISVNLLTKSGRSSTNNVKARHSSKRNKRGTKKENKSSNPTLDEFFIKKSEKSIIDVLNETARQDPVEDMKSLSKVPSGNSRQPKLVTGGILKDYQLAGLEWLISLYENGLNGILADEMGLGKTLQTISFLAFLREKGTMGPFLIVAPLSTLKNWVNEVEKFTPLVPVLLYHGNPQEREEMREKFVSNKVNDLYPIVITSYNIVMNDSPHLRRVMWKYIIIDEGHRIKNMNCRLIKELKSYASANRLLLTGTPLQNNLAELWSLLNFLLPDIFHDLELFQSWFDFSALNRENGSQEIIDQESKNSIVSNLHAILKPFLLRRLKSDVELDLPPKREYILYAPMTTSQEELYRSLLSHNAKEYLIERILSSMKSKRKSSDTPDTSRRSKRARVDDSSKRSKRRTVRRAARQFDGKYAELTDAVYFKRLLESPEEMVDQNNSLDEEEETEARVVERAGKLAGNKKLQNLIMQLRLACDSPHLFYAPWENPDSAALDPDESLIHDSGKMLLLDRLIPALFEKDHKVLIFSQFSKMLDLIQDWAELLRGWKVSRLDGSVSQEERELQIDSFNNDADTRLFLLSTRAGGLGINLTIADTVILFDSDWNPQQDLQAMDRVHRIGQTKPVLVYRLATVNTVEQTMLEKADIKRKLEKLVIQKGKFRSLISSTSSDSDIKNLLLNSDGSEMRFIIKGKDDEILSDKELETLLDRNDYVFSATREGESTSVYKVVNTVTGSENDLLS